MDEEFKTRQEKMRLRVEKAIREAFNKWVGEQVNCKCGHVPKMPSFFAGYAGVTHNSTYIKYPFLGNDINYLYFNRTRMQKMYKRDTHQQFTYVEYLEFTNDDFKRFTDKPKFTEKDVNEFNKELQKM